jgi:hypothetical protein
VSETDNVTEAAETTLYPTSHCVDIYARQTSVIRIRDLVTPADASGQLGVYQCCRSEVQAYQKTGDGLMRMMHDAPVNQVAMFTVLYWDVE